MRRPGAVRVLDRRTPEERDRPFLPGMARTWLVPFYDISSRLSGVPVLHRRAVELAGIKPGQSVIDVGCGTGNLSFAMLAARPDAQITGLDPDGAALRLAARKARRRGVSLTLVQGYADRLPTEDASIDHVVSSLALHHLDEDSRAGFAREALRTLRPGGTITIVDFGGSAHGTDDPDDTGHPGHRHPSAHVLRHLRHRLHAPWRQQRAAHDLGDAVPVLLALAGFTDAREIEHANPRFGRISFVRATRP